MKTLAIEELTITLNQVKIRVEIQEARQVSGSVWRKVDDQAKTEALIQVALETREQLKNTVHENLKN